MKDSVAYCGLFCESCGVLIATRGNDESELSRIAAKMNTTKEEVRCRGCRSSVLSPHCRNCEFRDCAKEKRIEGCEQCADFPCEALREFQKKAPHRVELFESARYRKDKGVEEWLEKMKDDYSCAECGAMNSPYYARCRACGAKPGNRFVARNVALFSAGG
jgi:ribosomal protein L40E